MALHNGSAYLASCADGGRATALVRRWPSRPEGHGNLKMTPTRWPSEPPKAPDSWPHPLTVTAMGRGLLGRCPACGKAHLFNGFLRLAPALRNCGVPLGFARADDAPPYFTILITGHIVVSMMFMLDRASEPQIWLMTLIFVPLTFFLALGLLRPIKGGPVAPMLTLNMLKTDNQG